MQNRVSIPRRSPIACLKTRSVSQKIGISRAGPSPFRVLKTASRPSRIQCADSSTQEVDVTELSQTTMLPPFPGSVQQTLWKSITVIGTGLHSGELSGIRVRPAFAGEGRYFVRVPVGTIPESVVPYEEIELDANSSEESELDVEAETRRTELFLKYLEYKEREGFIGTFPEFVREYAKRRGLDQEWQRIVNRREEPIAKRPEDIIIPASLDCAHETDNPFHTVLQNPEGELVKSVEYLLAALEACGVDNARIEVEGNCEIPSIDGSAGYWTEEVVRAGIAAASFEGGDVMIRAAMKPQKVIHVQQDDAFVLLVPSDRMELTCGIDYSKDAAVIGRQWHTWCLQDKEAYFGETLALAKDFATSKATLQQYVREGFFKGIQEHAVIIADGAEWSPTSEVMYRDDEPVRHRLLELIGDLSLLSNRGMSGLPFGHIIAYKSTHALHHAFARKVLEECSEQYQPFSVDSPLDVNQPL